MNKKLFLTLALISGSSLNSGGAGARTLKAPSETEIIQEEEAACRQKLEKEESQWLEAISKMAQIKPTDDESKKGSLSYLFTFALETENPELKKEVFYFSVQLINSLTDQIQKKLALQYLHKFVLKAENLELINELFSFFVEQVKICGDDSYKIAVLKNLQDFALQNKAENRELIKQAFEFYKEQIKEINPDLNKTPFLINLSLFALQTKDKGIINKTFYFYIKLIKKINPDWNKIPFLINLKDFVREAFVEGDLIRDKVERTTFRNFDELVAFVNKKVDDVLTLISQGALMKLKNPEILPQEIRDKRSRIIAVATSLFERGVPKDLIIQTLSWNRFSRAEAFSLIHLIPELEKALKEAAEEDSESVASYSSDSSDYS